jgi:hypothetical protein
MSAKNIPRILASWAVVAFVAAVLYVFITPRYRQGEPSIAGKKPEDFPLTVAGKQTHSRSNVAQIRVVTGDRLT